MNKPRETSEKAREARQGKTPKPLDPILEDDLKELAQMETILSPYWSVRSVF